MIVITGSFVAQAEHYDELEALIGHVGDSDLGLGRGEGMRRHEGVPTGEGVEQGRLPRVGEADKAEAIHRHRR